MIRAYFFAFVISFAIIGLIKFYFQLFWLKIYYFFLKGYLDAIAHNKVTENENPLNFENLEVKHGKRVPAKRFPWNVNLK